MNDMHVVATKPKDEPARIEIFRSVIRFISICNLELGKICYKLWPRLALENALTSADYLYMAM